MLPSPITVSMVARPAAPGAPTTQPAACMMRFTARNAPPAASPTRQNSDHASALSRNPRPIAHALTPAMRKAEGTKTNVKMRWMLVDAPHRYAPRRAASQKTGEGGEGGNRNVHRERIFDCAAG